MKKFLLIALTVVLLVSTVGIVAYASGEDVNAEPYMDFSTCSVIFGNTTYLRYRVVADNVSSINNVRLLVWKDAQEEYVFGTEDYCISPVGSYTHSSGAKYPQFYFENIATKQMSEDFYAVLYYEENGQEYYSPRVLKYSILQYAYNKLGYTGTASKDQSFIDLLNLLLEYGTAAQIYFDNYNMDRPANADYYQVKLTNAYLDDKTNSGLYLENDVVNINANAPAEGYTFSHWTDEKGDVIGYQSSMQISVVNANKVYTANYRVADTSFDYFDFTTLADGTYSVAAKDKTNLPANIVFPAVYNGVAITKISDNAFSGANIESVTIPAGYVEIGASAFSGCASLSSVSLPATVTVVGDNAFDGCSALASVNTDAGSVNSWSDSWTNLTVTVNAGQNNVKSNALYDYVVYGEKAYITLYKGSEEVPVVPSVIDGYEVVSFTSSFNSNNTIKGVVVPNSILNMAPNAFDGCSNISYIYVISDSAPDSWSEGWNADKTVVYGFSGNTTTYTFISDGETVQTVESEYAIDGFPVLTKTGYTFGGWYLSEAFEGEAMNFCYSGSSVSLYAKWTPNEYTLNLNSNGTVTSEKVTYGSAFVLPIPTREGYSFNGWYSGRVIVESGIWNYTTDKTLIAKWTANTYNVTFVDDINKTEETVSVTYGTSVTLPSPTSTAGAFLGWYNGDSLVESGLWSIASDVTLIANYDVQYYTMSLNFEENITEYRVVYGIPFELPEVEKEGYTFKGWYSGRVKVEAGIWNYTSNKTFIAMFSANEYNVTYVDPYMGTEETVSVTYDKTFTTPTPAQSPYTSFIGWYNGDVIVESGTWKYTDDLILTARWDKEIYKLTLDNQGEISEITMVEGQPFELPELSMTGYNFLGWYNGETRVNSGTWSFDEDVTLVAKFVVSVYTLTLVDELNGTTEETDYSYGSEFVLAAPEARVDAEFLGWYDGDVKVEPGTWYYTDDVTLYAKWRIDTSDGETLPEDKWN